MSNTSITVIYHSMTVLYLHVWKAKIKISFLSPIPTLSIESKGKAYGSNKGNPMKNTKYKQNENLR